MRCLILLVALLLAGCANNFIGPWRRICQPPVRIDDPRLTIQEQQSLQRSRVALPEASMNVAPRTFAEYPDFVGRVVQ